jgi:multidrug efflux system outer membrane protein
VTPQTYRGAPAGTEATASSGGAAASFGDEKWWEVFQDAQLQSLIRTALQQNYDVRIAASRILQAQAELGITRSNELPSAAAIAIGNGSRNARSKFFNEYDDSYTELGLGFAPRKRLAINCLRTNGRGRR